MQYKEFTPIGKVNFRSDARVFGIKYKDRLGHIYSIGKTGTGKSTLLLNMAISDILRGRGLCVIDPHSDVAERLLEYVPHHRITDVIYFNPSDGQFPIAFNPLRNVHPDFQHLVCSGLISTFKKIWADSWGPRLEYILRFSLLTLLEYRQGSLLDIQPLLTDKEFRNNILSFIKSQHILDFWYKEFDKFSPNLRSEAISPILNKVGVFSSSKILRGIVGQKGRSLSLKKVLDEGKIIIANLSKGKLGEDISSLLGSMLVNAIQLEALYRARQAEHERRPFYLYVDECHSFVTGSFADILAESRKYGLGLFLANQYIEQLTEEIRSAIFGNVGTLISFRIGATDAEYVAKELFPTFNEEDLINLPRYSMYLKLMIDGATSQAFSAITLPLSESSSDFRNEVIESSRKQYSQLDKNLEDEIVNMLKSNNLVVQDNLF